MDANSAFDHLVRESTGGHCRRTAQEPCAEHADTEGRRPLEALSLFRLCVTDLGKCEKHVHEALGSPDPLRQDAHRKRMSLPTSPLQVGRPCFLRLQQHETGLEPDLLFGLDAAFFLLRF